MFNNWRQNAKQFEGDSHSQNLETIIVNIHNKDPYKIFKNFHNSSF